MELTGHTMTKRASVARGTAPAGAAGREARRGGGDVKSLPYFLIMGLLLLTMLAAYTLAGPYLGLWLSVYVLFAGCAFLATWYFTEETTK